MKWRRFIPHTLLFFAGLGYALWSFVRLPFPMLDENPLLDLVDYHTPNFYGWVMLWYYASPFVAVMFAGLILMSVWKVWLEGRDRDFATFGGLPVWPLSPRQKAPAIVVGEVHHPVEAREIFNPSLAHHPGAGTVHRRGDLRGRRVRQDFGLHAPVRPPASLLASGGSPEAGGGADARSQGGFLPRHPPHPGRSGAGERLHRARHEGPLAMEPAFGLVARFLLAGLHRFLAAQSTLRQGQGALLATGLYQSGALDHRTSPALPERWVTLQQVYRCAIDPELFAAKIEQAEAWSDELNQGTVFVSRDVYQAQIMHLAQWPWEDVPETKELKTAYARTTLKKLDELKLTYRVVWDPGPGDEVRERVEAVKRWFVNDWQMLDNKIKSSIVEGVFRVSCHVRYAGCGPGVLPRRGGNPR